MASGDSVVVLSQSGPQGPKGPKGDGGQGIAVKGLFQTVELLKKAHPTGQVGDVYAVGIEGIDVHLYCWNSATKSWEDMGAFVGPVGPEGPQGVQGDPGQQGEDGPAGPQGEQGPEGAQGPAGDPGKDGEQGLVGPAGPQGEIGPIGPKGDTGDRGEALDIKGHYDTEEELRAAHPVGAPGDYYLVGDGYLYAWSSSASDWQNVGKLQGPKGDQGDAGEAGPAGPVGAQGPAGESGKDGDQGPVGPTGATGKDGYNGQDGFDGKDGIDGAPGKDGEPGKQGEVGPVGETGPAGEPGPKGDKGEKGDAGSGSASHRLVWPKEKGFHREVLTHTDVNGYVAFFDEEGTGSIAFFGVDLADPATDLGAVVSLSNIVDAETLLVLPTDPSKVVIFSPSAKSSEVIAIKALGEAQFTYIGLYDNQEDAPRHTWLARGALDKASPDFRCVAPHIETAIPHEASFTVKWTQPQEDGVPDPTVYIISYSTDSQGWNHEVTGDVREATITEGVVDGKTYTVTMTGWYGEAMGSEDSNAVEVLPHGDIPGAPTLIAASGVWDGVQMQFRAPTDPKHLVTGYRAHVGQTDYFITDVTGTDLLTGYVHGLPPQTSDVSICGLVPPYGETPDSVKITKVLIGPQTVNPSLSAVHGGAPMTVYIALGKEPAGEWTQLRITTTEKGKTPVTFLRDRKAGETSYVTDAIGANKTVAVTYAVSYPAGWSKESNSLNYTTPNDFDPTAPKNWKVENTSLGEITITCDDEIGVPRTGIIVEVDGYAFPPSGRVTKITDHLAIGVECKVRIAFAEINSKQSDFSDVKTIVPAGKPVTAPTIMTADQMYLANPGNMGYDATPDGITAQFVEGKCEWPTGNNWAYALSYDDGATWGEPVKLIAYGPDPNFITFNVSSPYDTIFKQYTVRMAQLYFSGKEQRFSPWSNAKTVSVMPFAELDQPKPSPALSVTEGEARLGIDFTVPENKHVTGIVVQYFVEGKSVKTEVQPVDWKGGVIDTSWATDGQQCAVTFAWQTWRYLPVFGYFKARPIVNKATAAMQWQKRDVKTDAPEVVNVNSPKEVS